LKNVILSLVVCAILQLVCMVVCYRVTVAEISG